MWFYIDAFICFRLRPILPEECFRKVLFSLETYMIDFHSVTNLWLLFKPNYDVKSFRLLCSESTPTLIGTIYYKWQTKITKRKYRNIKIIFKRRIYRHLSESHHCTTTDTSDQSFRHFFWTFLRHFLPYVPAPWTPVWGTGTINLSRPRGGCGAGRLQSVKVRLVCGQGGRGVSNMGLPQRSVIMRQNMCPDLQ